jgi:predicted O-methyltransferase YrrM
MSRTHTPITDELAEYVRRVTLREPEPLRRLREESETHPDAGLQTAPEQCQFLHFLARATGARRAIEVGVFMGYSATWIALALPPGGKLVACDVSEEFTARAREVWREAGVETRVDLRLAPALETLDGLIAAGESGTYDFAYIDADKGNYLNYYERALTLLRPGGVIAADNVLWKGAICDASDHEPDTERMRAFNRALHGDSRVALSMATMGDGLALACKL